MFYASYVKLQMYIRITFAVDEKIALRVFCVIDQ